MLVSLLALFAAGALMVGLAALAVRREVAALSQWTDDLAARRADVNETVALSAGGAAFAAAVADFAERHESDVHERKTEREASERVGAHEAEFLRSISHELRTPLNAILGFSTVLLDGIDGPLNAAQRESVTAVQKSGEYLGRLVDEVLEVAALETGHVELEPGPVNVRALLEEVRSILEGVRGPKPVELRIDLDGDVGGVRGDPKRLQQILMNLGANAVKATEAGAVVLGARRDGNVVELTVQDTGPGLPTTDQEALFEPFSAWSTDRGGTRQGSGLGLAIAKQLTELHGGTIRFETAPKRGTTFFLRFPADGRSP